MTDETPRRVAINVSMFALLAANISIGYYQCQKLGVGLYQDNGKNGQ